MAILPTEINISDDSSSLDVVSTNDVLLEPSSDFCLATVLDRDNSSSSSTTAATTTTTTTAATAATTAAGGGVVGNNRFRILVDMNRKAYSDATTDEERKAVVSKIIDIICNQFSPEGRFLERQATPIESDHLLSLLSSSSVQQQLPTAAATADNDGVVSGDDTPEISNNNNNNINNNDQEHDGCNNSTASSRSDGGGGGDAEETNIKTTTTTSPLSKFSWRKLDLDESFYRVEQALQAGVTMDYPKSSSSSSSSVPPQVVATAVANKEKEDVVGGEEQLSVEGHDDDDDDDKLQDSTPTDELETSLSPSEKAYLETSSHSTHHHQHHQEPPQQQSQRRRSSVVSMAENAFSRVFPRRRSSAVDIAAANERRRRRRSSTIGSITETILVALLGSDARRNSTTVNTNNSNPPPTSSSKDAGKRRKKHLEEENYDDVLDDLLIPLPSASQRGHKILLDLHDYDDLEYDYVGGSARELHHHHHHHGALLLEGGGGEDSEDFVQEHNTLDVIISYDGTQLDARCNNPGNIRIKILMDNLQETFGKLAPKEQRAVALELVNTVQKHWSGRFLKSGIRTDHPFLVLTTSQAELALHALLLKQSRKYIIAAANGGDNRNSSSIDNHHNHINNYYSSPLLSGGLSSAEHEARLPSLQETEDDQDSSTFNLGVVHEPSPAAFSLPTTLNGTTTPHERTWSAASSNISMATGTTPHERKWSAASSNISMASSTATASSSKKGMSFKLPTLNSLQKDAIQTLQARKQRSVQRQRINRGGSNPKFQVANSTA